MSVTLKVPSISFGGMLALGEREAKYFRDSGVIGCDNFRSCFKSTYQKNYPIIHQLLCGSAKSLLLFHCFNNSGFSLTKVFFVAGKRRIKERTKGSLNQLVRRFSYVFGLITKLNMGSTLQFWDRPKS